MNEKIISRFMEKNFKHFNSYSLLQAAKSYKTFVEEKNGKMMLAIAGALSTAEIGITLAEMIRKDKVHAISCTGANLEEDIFNLVAHKHYKAVPNYRYLREEDDYQLYLEQYNRVTDTCIPEEEAMRKIESKLLKKWKNEKERKFPHEYIYELILDGELENDYQIDPNDSWVVAAAKKNLPIFIGGWEDSTLGNFYVANYKKNKINSLGQIKSGLEYMDNLIDWYLENSKKHPMGFFQVGGGIAGDFPICVVPLIIQDLKIEVPKWKYFCQISDSTTSYGSYSGATPNEKITWGKLDLDSEKFVIESDASIVLPLIFAYVLGY
ncbi:MAG: deoxyhypusine synthase family protein [Candidatus Anstonellaceae archaeon]